LEEILNKDISKRIVFYLMRGVPLSLREQPPIVNERCASKPKGAASNSEFMSESNLSVRV